jgi:hypothetical protein
MIPIAENPGPGRKTCPNATLPIINVGLTGLGSNMGLLSDRLIINCLGDGAAIMVVLT